ncbi:conserved hypothetical protein [Hyella patelloides LEGE 07179]|uniref:DUF4340 domain-containing protein n=1 Tax=Hyella patelloides LEGE 07179 TaxID=945734 RepID=A0A563VJ37_9CYAN|nr:DUF4340 domain-containing protein [Hyella patelloides]VEP11454.1 conserved hypothetical protein [Hyella patelloides LEGE 07179]
MKLQKSTLFLVLIAIILGGLVYLVEIRSEQQQQEITIQEQKLFNINVENIKRIIIQKSDTILEFIASDNSWQMIQPEKLIASDGVMAFLLDLIAEGKSDRILEIAPNQLSQYGLESPIATITIELNNGQQQQILLGKETIDPKLIYAQVITDNNKSTIEIVIVSKNWQYAIDRDLAEWQDSNI